jgi:DNA-binding CsgD family transcriptional regulator
VGGEVEALRRRHATYFLEFEQGLYDDRIRPTRWMAVWTLDPLRTRSLDQLERDQDNLRIATRWLIDSGDADHAVRLAEALFQIDQIRGSTTEGLAWLGELLTAPAVVRTPAAREHILALLGLVALRHGQYPTALAAFGELLATYRSESDQLGVATALCNLATAHFDQGDYLQARASLEESQAAATGIKDQALALSWRLQSAGIALHEGRLDEARVLFEEAMGIRESGWLFTGWNKKDLGWVALEQGAYPEARSLLEHSLQMGEQVGDRHLLAYSLEAALGQHERAMCLAGAGAALREATGGPLPPTWQRMLERWLAISRASLSAAVAATAWKIGFAMPLEEAIRYAREPFETTRDAAVAPAESAVTSALDRLTRREQEVAALVAEGLTNAQIAERLVITRRTAAAHVEHILNKLGFASRHQVAAWAADHSLTN